jgi:membrane protein required for colicin V production
VNLLDWILIGIVSISVIAAAMRGFVYEIWMMLAALAAIVLAAWEYGVVAAHLGWIPSEAARSVTAFALVVIAVLFVAALAGRLMRGLLHTAGLGLMDRLLGAGLGFARGVALAAALVLVLTAYPVETHWVQRSTLAPDLLWGSRALVTVMPPGMVTRFESGVRAEWRHLAQP